MPTILVTGGAGFIGSNFCHYWQQAHPDDSLIVLDALTYAGTRDNLVGAKHDFVLGSIRLAEFLDIKADIVVHFAAETHVDRSIASSAKFLETNVLGTQAIIDLALRDNMRLHHVSTDEVYGSLGLSDKPFTEQSRYNPSSPYAASKAASDHLVRAAIRTHGLKATISHGCNTYGPRQHEEKLIPTLLRSDPMPIYGDGINWREWIYVEDHCRAIDCILQHGKLGESYNIGSGVELPNLEIAKLIDKPIEFVKDRLGHDSRYALDSSKLRKLGFVPKWDFDTGLKATVEWYEHRASA